MPIRSERVSERRIGIDNDGESGRKGLLAGMIFPFLYHVSHRQICPTMIPKYVPMMLPRIAISNPIDASPGW